MTGLLKLTPRLTRDPVRDAASTTYQGMAHFAGTGPAGKTCRECRFWRPTAGPASHQYGLQGSKHGRQLKEHCCFKFRALTGAYGPKIPHKVRACKYFEPAEKTPPIFDPKGAQP